MVSLCQMLKVLGVPGESYILACSPVGHLLQGHIELVAQSVFLWCNNIIWNP